MVVLLIDELQYLGEDELGVYHGDAQGPAKNASCRLSSLVPVFLNSLAIWVARSPMRSACSNSQSWAHSRAGMRLLLSPSPCGTKAEQVSPERLWHSIEASEGYPYFIQTWGYEAWKTAVKSPISRRDVEGSERSVLRNLDESFFRVRFDRLTPGEKRYLRAMAEFGPGPHRSGTSPTLSEVKVQSVAPTRNSLIKKGMIYSPAHGDTTSKVRLRTNSSNARSPSIGWIGEPHGCRRTQVSPTSIRPARGQLRACTAMSRA